MGHKLQKVSEVVETQLRQLKESLGNEHSVLRLQKLLSDAESRGKQLTEHRENLLRNVVDREKEIMEKVRQWREKMTEEIIALADDQQKSLEKDVTLTSAVLQCKDKDLELGTDQTCVQIIFLNRGLKNLLSKDTSLPCFEFRIGMTNDHDDL